MPSRPPILPRLAPSGSTTGLGPPGPADNPYNAWYVTTWIRPAERRQGHNVDHPHLGVERRFDVVLWRNGFPLVVGEAKSPVRPAYSWIDAAAQIN